MSERSAFMSGLDLASSALNAHALKAHLAAFNIANVSTQFFKPARLDLATGPEDKGVRVSAILRENKPICSDSIGIGASDKNLEISGTDLAEEFVHLIEAKTSFTANAKVIGVIDELGETLLNIKT